MAKTIGMPKFGLTMETGVVNKWLKRVGDRVEKGDALVEISTDKIVNEYESPHSGYLLRILLDEGQEAKVLDPICVLGEQGEPVADEAAPAAAPRAQAAPAAPAPETAAAPARAGQRVSPLARKLAGKHGIDLASVQGTGPNGRILKEDVEKAIRSGPAPAPAAAAPGPAPAPAGGETVEPMSEMRRIIAERLSQSKREIPHFYLKMPVDMSRALALKEDFALEQEKRGTKITVTHVILAAVARTLAEFPEVNVSCRANASVRHAQVNVGLAVDIPGGLIVPVVKDADRKPFAELAAAANDLVARARAGKLDLAEITGGTFTITNMGMYGVTEFNAIINPPEAAILAVGAIRQEPVVEQGALVPKPMMTLTLSVDHRVIDGGLGARFLGRVRQLLEHPFALM
ncbi:MAG: 2-oxo acid dehydrogenase subunit E2 [Kiritimatiellae bacterium]|nr:2-oxo acid dehydrogenase subunit E2 [Kiritimatiellia bacterium]